MALDRETLNQFISTLERFVSDRLMPLEEQISVGTGSHRR